MAAESVRIRVATRNTFSGVNQRRRRVLPLHLAVKQWLQQSTDQPLEIMSRLSIILFREFPNDEVMDSMAARPVYSNARVRRTTTHDHLRVWGVPNLSKAGVTLCYDELVFVSP